MFKRALKKGFQESLSLTSSYAVGIYFNDVRMSCVQLKMHGGQLFLQSYKTIPLEKGIVINSKIVEMDALVANLRQLSKDFSRYTRQIVASLPQSLVTIDYFTYDSNDAVQPLEAETEARAASISDLEKISFDYHLFEDEENLDGTQANVILAIAKKEDVDSRMYLMEVSGLELYYLDVESASRANAYSFWINQEQPSLENELIAIYDIDVNDTQVIFCKRGKILYSGEISIGSSLLLGQIPEYANLSHQQVLRVLLRNDFDWSQYDKSLLRDVRRRLSQEIYRSIRVFYSQSHVTESDVSSIFLTGIGARSFGIEDVLQDMTGTSVQVLNPIEYVQNSLNSEQLHFDAFHLTVAFGLALRGLL